MIEFKSREGYYLTQSADVPNEDRIFIMAIKGVNVREEDWREATEKEKEDHEKAMSGVDADIDIMRENGDTRSE